MHSIMFLVIPRLCSIVRVELAYYYTRYMKQYSETRKARTLHQNMRLNIAPKFMHPHEIRLSLQDENDEYIRITY